MRSGAPLNQATRLSELIDLAAERAPDEPGLRCRGRDLTWRAYARRVNALAATLRDLGVRRGDRVGLWLEKSLESGVGLFGTMKAGAAYVPVDPAAPMARVRFLLEDCGIRHLVVDPARLPCLRELEAGGLELSAVVGVGEGSLGRTRCVPWEEVARREGASEVGGEGSEDDLAYLMYTSGSTGTPKGIMHTHRSGLAFARWAAVQFGFGPLDRLANHAPLHFDLSTLDYFSAPLAGAATVVVPGEYLKVPASYARLLVAEGITVLYTVPFALIQLRLRGALERSHPAALRWVLFAGEPMPTVHLRGLMSAWPHVRFANLYGPAETNVCTFHEVPALPPDRDDPIPIGRPCPGVEVRVLDDSGQEAAPGEPGELLAMGPTTMTGYWRRPDLDAAAFVDHGPGDGGSRRFYRTGDLVVRREDGVLDFLGRRDRQVKTRGYRVELDEVETVLGSHPRVEEAAAFTLPDGEGSRQIAMTVTLREAGAVAVPELLQYARDRLPWYAVPARLEIVGRLPRTSSGKVDRRSLESRFALPASAEVPPRV